MAVPLNKPVVCPVLIGRTAELTTLHLLIDQAKSGAGGVALLSGEAGIGKSRLVAEVKTYAPVQDFLLFQGNCFPTDISCPYAPLLDLLRSTFVDSSTANTIAALGSSARALFPLLPDLVPPPLDLAPLPSLEPEQEKRRLFATLTQFFMNQTTKQPALLIVEDLHWSDDTSLEFLSYLARRCVAQPLLLLLTYRSDEARPALWHWLAQLDREHLAQEVALAHLERNDVNAMLHAIFDPHRSVQLELLDTIYTLTEGNPFFIEEVLRSLIAAGEIFYVNGVWCHKPPGELRVPRSVQDAVQQRTAQLSESAKRFLLLAAVAGRRFDFSLLQHLTQQSEQQLLLLIKELIAAQLVVEESTEQFAFRHALTQQAIYAQLLARERKALHRAMVEAMEHLSISTPDPHLADLAYHSYQADAWAKAFDYGQRAGEKAQGLHSPRAAIEHFTRALEAARQLAVTPPPQLYHARGQVYETLGQFEDARGDYERALDTAREAHDVLAEWQSLIDLGLLWTGRDYERAGALFRRALDLAQTLAETVLTPVLDVDAPAQTIGQRLVWCARAELALARGKPDHALAITDHLLASAANVSPERNILRVSKLRGEVLAALHQRAEAKIALQRAQEIAHAQGARSMQWRISVALGKLYQALHQHEEAERAFSTAQRIIEELAANIPDQSLREHFLASATALIPRTHPLSLLRATKQALSGLTPREREVATLIGRGKSNREIGDRLVVSERTVETHVRNVLTKLDFTSRTQIAAWAVKKGLVDDQ